MRPNLRFRGFAALYASAVVFSLNSLTVKFAAKYYSGLFISGARFVIGIGLCLGVLFWRYGGLRPKRPGLVALRGLFGSLSMIAGYMAVARTGPGRAILLTNTYPLFVALFGAAFFGEGLRPRTLASVGVCTVGAVLVVRDGSGASLAGDLFALASALAAGMAVNYVRRASQTENPFTLYLSPCLFGLPIAAFASRPAASGGAEGILLLLGVGLLSFAAQALMSKGYESVSASEGSVVFYLETLLSVLLGLLFAGERLTWRFALGLAVILAGLWLNQAPRRYRATRPREEGPPAA